MISFEVVNRENSLLFVLEKIEREIVNNGEFETSYSHQSKIPCKN